MPWCFVPRECFRDLTSDPLSGRIGGHAYPDQPPARVAENHQTIQQLERDGAHHEQVEGSDAGGMVAQEGLPAL